ncbi:hypothetical protein AMTRI_Chr04g252460 [Amborella trichopoda]|uniref:RIN4 pathogenic type III effector avirulence factor Avr cleavage site domain-containing protein n=2 Tax=Amborella trichopoda TaxID=13333 RepID=W1NFV1_AMBTC|nr:hypothetical protein AMTR_s00010p00247150 [Amborella trichopoda]
MEDRKERNACVSVPQFGAWESQCDMPNYSMDFSMIRELKKQNKKDFSRASLGNEEELIHHHHHSNSPTTRKKLLSYFNCFIKA